MTEIPESYQRILRLLGTEKHLTIRQIARVLYPEENQKTVYERVAKQLKTLQREKLLNSKSYGLGLEYFWSLANHPLTKEYHPPRGQVHRFKYNHELLCGNFFVHIYLKGNLTGWQQRRVSKDIIPDRVFYLGDQLCFLEAETGSQKESDIRDKLEDYKQYHYETGEKFHVWFVTDNQRMFKLLEEILRGEPSHYEAYLLSNTDSNTLSKRVEEF